MRFHTLKSTPFQYHHSPTSIAFNSSLRRDDPTRTDPSAVRQGQGLGPSPFSSVVGPSGDWSFVEELTDDGISVLTLRYKGVKVHSFVASATPPDEP